MTDILAIRKMQIKTTVRYYLTHVGMVTIKKTQEIGSVGKDMAKRGDDGSIWYETRVTKCASLPGTELI